ncbi:MAG: phenylalanine--tRNA ligase subunit beta, partial [Bdellovibrionales bacterium]|nr:phenylalanine--tRNA ligase subunit beta [Bdellovibrionales bacterium]
MKVSLNWLKDYIDLPQELSAHDLAYQLTMCTVEVEAVEDLAAQFEKMVVGKIVSIEQHPNADKLKIVNTDTGAGAPVGIVCGGSNLTEGMFVAIAQTGAKVQWHGEGDLIELKPATIRGVKSEGMICAANEIGLAHLFPMNDEKEIVDLTALSQENALTPGMGLAKALRLDDIILEIDNKSLTNRPDLWGHYGIARELAAIYNLELRPSITPVELPKGDSKVLSVSISEPTRSNRYMGVAFECEKGLQSPYWMKTRLALMGQRSINLLVDLTNYVLFSLGQPMHVFDRGKLHGTAITVRNAKEGERIKLLDEQEYELTKHDLVIADEKTPVALAGVMGGLESSVTDSTTHVLLESANFEPTGIRKAGSRYGLRSESSMRFEKGIDSTRAKEGIFLYLSLLKDLAPKISLTASEDCFPVAPQAVTVCVSRDFINSRIGRELSSKEIQEKLERLSFGVSESKGEFTLSVPSWRATGDVSIPEDIVEEVARMYGYDNIEFVAPKIILERAIFQPPYDALRQV